jgi:hypothetical protein
MKQAIHDSARMVKDEQASVLPHPSVTSKNLHEHLAAVTFHPYALGASSPPNPDEGIKGKARAVRDTTRSVAAFSPASQKAFNYSLVQLLHQIEHRTRRQEIEISRLTAEVARLNAERKLASPND